MCCTRIVFFIDTDALDVMSTFYLDNHEGLQRKLAVIVREITFKHFSKVYGASAITVLFNLFSVFVLLTGDNMCQCTVTAIKTLLHCVITDTVAQWLNVTLWYITIV